MISSLPPSVEPPPPFSSTILNSPLVAGSGSGPLKPTLQGIGMSKSYKGLTFALISGVLASIAGTFGKFSMTQSETIWYCENLCISSYVSMSGMDATNFCNGSAFYLQGFAFMMMILVNGIMWTTFVKALRFCSTTLEATVTNTAANFFSSAIVGRVLFDESMSLLWWTGTLLILFGLMLMNLSSKGIKITASSFLRNKDKPKKKHKTH